MGAIIPTHVFHIAAITPPWVCKYMPDAHACVHICKHMLDDAHACAYKDAIMPPRVCEHMRDLDHACVRSCLVYASICVIMTTRVCAHMVAIVPTLSAHARSCPCVSAHIGAIMPTSVCTHRRDHAHAYMHT